MAAPTAVNDQITDSVTQTTVQLLGGSPALAMGELYQASAQALSNAAHNATLSAKESSTVAQAATVQGTSLLYSVDTAAAAVATAKIFNSDIPEAIALLDAVLEAFQGPSPPLPPVPRPPTDNGGVHPAPLPYNYPEEKDRLEDTNR